MVSVPTSHAKKTVPTNKKNVEKKHPIAETVLDEESYRNSTSIYFFLERAKELDFREMLVFLEHILIDFNEFIGIIFVFQKIFPGILTIFDYYYHFFEKQRISNFFAIPLLSLLFLIRNFYLIPLLFLLFLWTMYTTGEIIYRRIFSEFKNFKELPNVRDFNKILREIWKVIDRKKEFFDDSDLIKFLRKYKYLEKDSCVLSKRFKSIELKNKIVHQILRIINLIEKRTQNKWPCPAFLWEFFDNDYSEYLSKEFQASFEKSPLKVKFIDCLDTLPPFIFYVLDNKIILQRELVYELWKDCLRNKLNCFSELRPLYIFATHLGWQFQRTSIKNQKDHDDQGKNPILAAIIQTILFLKEPKETKNEIKKVLRFFNLLQFFFPFLHEDDSFKKISSILTNPVVFNFLKKQIHFAVKVDSEDEVEVDSIEKQLSDQLLLYQSQDNNNQDLLEKLLQLKNAFKDESFIQKFS